MSRKSHIVPLGTGGAEQGPDEGDNHASLLAEVPGMEQPWHQHEDEAGSDAADTSGSAMRRWIWPALAALLIAGWTGFHFWAYHAEILAGVTPDRWSALIVAWVTPVLLVVALWLLAMRTSSREAARFNDAARALSEESRLLEHRLERVNRELSLAREFLTAQGRDLESFGRMASERLSTHADRIKSLVLENDAQVQAIASVSTTAMENMDRLRGDLPVIANSARDVANQIGAAGRAADGQLATLVKGFQRLNEFGSASERQVQSIRKMVEQALAELSARTDQLEDIATARFAALTQNSEALRTELGQNEIEALAAIRRRADSLHAEIASSREILNQQENQWLEAMQARLASLQSEHERTLALMEADTSKTQAAWLDASTRLRSDLQATLEQTRASADAAIAVMQEKLDTVRAHGARFEQEQQERRSALAEEQARDFADLENRMAAFDARIRERRESQMRLARDFAEQGDALKRRLETLHGQIGSLADQGEHIQSGLADGLASMAGAITNSRQQLESMDQAVSSLTDASIRLLEVIHASAQHSREHLPAALADAEQRLSTFRSESEAISFMLSEAGRTSEDLSAHIMASRHEQAEAMRETEVFQGKFTANLRHQEDVLSRLRADLDALAEAGVASSAQMARMLEETLEQVSGLAQEALDRLEKDSAAKVQTIARTLGDDGVAILDEALRVHLESNLAHLAEAADKAMALTQDAASQLRDQLAKVDELAGHLEARVNHTRARAEEQADQDFARRVALITEALNSHAIDISKALSSEVTDTAWASYLKGDRGIFTRRAIRLLDHGSARAVYDLYAQDADFREHLNRYVHDFEAMLRMILSTRDGHALGVTLLSSDMGKLYVALAQAIERLRS